MSDKRPDPLLTPPPSTVRKGDHVILVFGDGKQIFAHVGKDKNKLNRRHISTANLVGLPYGTVLEQGPNSLVPLPAGDLLPDYPAVAEQKAASAVSSKNNDNDSDDDKSDDPNAVDTTFPPVLDNRHIVDDNRSQALGQQELLRLKLSGTEGSAIVEKIIQHSATFDQKTAYSKAKYVAKKQMKYQPRCRLVRCTAATICQALYAKDAKKMMNVREDTLGQILSYSNVSAGSQALVMETCLGVVTGAVAERMGGYGKVLSIYSGQQPAFTEMIGRFNLSFAENVSIKWIHSGDVFGADNKKEEDGVTDDGGDPEKDDREILKWPCPLQPHTLSYVQEDMSTDQQRAKFLAKRSARFARKLTRHTAAEANGWLNSRQSDSLIIVARYDPTATLLKLLPYLQPSCPFVVYCEFIEPLTECFRELQRQDLAINLRLSDTWAREYQVLPGRTHPNMNMSQSGGFILTGIKLDPDTGRNELDEELLKEIRAQIGGRRGRNPKQKKDGETSTNKRGGKRRKKAPTSSASGSESKRQRVDN